MSNPFLGEIRLVAFNFPPIGWQSTVGQLLPISQNTALFSLLGTQYGGDGKSNFALPNLQGNVAIGIGQGSGLSNYFQGETGGSQTVTLLTTETPPHTHTFEADNGRPGTSKNPANGALAKTEGTFKVYAPSGGTAVQMNPGFLSTFGGNQPHNNMMPYLTLNWVIAMQGVYPSRS